VKDKDKKLRWGILGAARIARKNWRAIQLTGNSRVTAVASRDLERSRQFIAECQGESPMEVVPRPYGSYEELLSSDDVDAVYIPLPTGVRKEWVLKAAKAGKHVLCEKPCAPNVTDLSEMLDACRQAGVQFMDDVMFVHSSRFNRIREMLNDGSGIGEVRRMTAAFSFLGSPEFFAGDIRMHSQLEPLGCLGDLGWYCVRLFLWVMNGKMPIHVSGRVLAEAGVVGSPGPVPTEFSGELLFEGDISAAFFCSFRTQVEEWAIVSGTKGVLQLDDFVLPFTGEKASFEIRKSEFRARGCDFRMDNSGQTIVVSEWSHGHPAAQEVNCFRNFAGQIHSGRINESWPEASLKTQTVVCACLDTARSRR
jgi:predicted dehydrogenase